MTDIEKAKTEEQRITSLLFSYGIPEEHIEMLAPVIENVSWMKAKLDRTRDEIEESSVAIPYDNGGGQKGIRENPLFKGYEALWKTYMTGYTKILEALPPEAAQAEAGKAEKPKTVLELVRKKHGREA